MVSRYVPNGPVKQEGICLLPPPHYRMIPPQHSNYLGRPTTPQRPEVYQLTPQPQYLQQPPNPAGNPNQLRAMGPTGPPTQASTPPAELKVSHGNQGQVNLAYLRQPQHNFNAFRPAPAPQSQRMANAPRTSQMGQMYAPTPNSTMFVQQCYYGNFPRPSVSPYQLPNPQMNYGFQPPGQYYIRAAAAPPPLIAQMPQNMPPPAVTHTQPPLYQNKEKPRTNAIPIIDPATGKEYVHNRDTAGQYDSPARHSPQPTAHNAHSKEVQVAFAKGVAQSLNDDVQEEHSEIPQPLVQQQHIEPPLTQPPFHANPPVHNTNRNELVQSSKLQVPKKDFVPANQTAKETPVVSAISNAEERTITNKQPKDRESPAKGRKQRPEQISQKEQIPKEPVKEKEVSVEKPVKEEKIKEIVAPPAPVPVLKEIKEKEKEDKKKKNEKIEVKVNKEEEVEIPIPVPENAKPKQNSQKGGKDTQKQGGGSTKQQVTVPQSQPAKPNNKSNKIKELNMKGANKEGTDMDAFSDNLDALNANVSTPTVPEPTGVQTTPVNQNANIICDSNKTSTESNETPTIKPEIKTLPMNRVDVTSIVKETPKPFVPPTPVEPKDETDRTSIANDKLVQAKNEVNAKASVDNDEAGDNKLALPYKDNQWSPYNKDGKKVYDKDFLIALRNFPMSKQKPDNLLNDILAQDDKARIGDVSRYGMNQRNDFAPPFGGGNNFPGKSQSHKASLKRTSMKGMVGGNSAKGGKSNSIIRVSISFKEDVKLHETENAWKPARFDPSANQTDEDKQTEELYKKVRGVLNKLTPQKFETLVDQIKTLPITTSDRLQGVIDLVFEKAVDEPNFSVAYALMCRELALMQVPTTAGGKDFVNFRKLIVSRCQMEFEKNSFDEGKRNERFKEIEACPDPVKKKELMVVLDEDDRRIRMKSVGNIRFIGELFKQAMLTTGIMERCLHHLLEDRDEERLECLCKLLTTIGKELQNKKVDLTKIFETMKEIADKKNTKVSSRVRFMLQDVIDLKSCNWIPRRQDLNPKTMDQIQKEAASEQLTIQAMNSGPITPRKDDRGSSMNSDRKRGGGRNNVNDEGWSTQTTRGKNQFSIQSDKFKINKQPTEGQEVLGSSQNFNIWVSGSQVKSNKNISSNPNPYAALMFDGGLMEMRPNSSRNSKDSYNSKRPSMERQYKQYDGRGSRSGSQHRSNESSERSTPTPAQPMPTFKTPQPVELSGSDLHSKIKNILAEYVHIGDSTVKSTCDEIKHDIPHTQLEAAISEIFNVALDNTKTCRLKTGKLFAELIERKVLSMDAFCRLLENVFSMYEDFIVDIPNIWEYYAEILSALINDGVLPLTKLHKCCAFLIAQRSAQKLLAPVFKLVIQEKGPSYVEEIWKESKLKLQDFMAADAVDEFVSRNKFEFLTGSGGETFVNSNLTYPQIQEKMSSFIKQNTPFDALKKWISANLGERVKEKEFIRALMTVILENSIEKDKKDYKLNLDKFRSFNNLFSLYVENNMEYELQCLHAVHALLLKLEHPKGLLLSIFSALYDENIVSQESFIKWEKTPDDIEEKGVILLQLTSFFTQLKENDDDSCSD